MNFAKKCKELRIKKAATQEQMATALKISPQAISKWENNISLPDITLLPEISTYFGVTIDELFDITTEKHIERIQTMLMLDKSITENEFAYAREFLLSHVTQKKHSEICLQLLPALYNHKADEYRKKAEHYAKEALAQFPENHNNHANLCEAQQGTCGDWNLNNHVERIRYYKDFLTQNPDSIEGLQWYITELLHVGRCDEAKEAIEKMKEYSIKDCNDHSCADTITYRIDIYRTKLLWEQGLHAESLALIEKLTTATPNNWFVLNFAGDIYAKACQYNKAIDCYRRSIDVQPKPRYTDAAMSIAQICEITGESAHAIEAWKLYIQILNSDWNIFEGEALDRANIKIQQLSNQII